MAWIVADSFDYYSTQSGQGDLSHSVWDSNDGAIGISGVGRFAGSLYAYSTFLGGGLHKTIPTNESTIFVVFAMYRSGAIPAGSTVWTAFTLRDGSTAQCSICITQGGKIELRVGDKAGAVVASYTGAFVQDTWTHFQCKVVIHPTAGSFEVRKDGVAVNSFTATGINTRATGNSFANGFSFVSGQQDQNTYIDDLLVFSGAGAAPNTWVGDCRAICLAPSGDTATKMFVPQPAGAAGALGQSSIIGQQWAVPANTVCFAGPYTISPDKSGSITTLTASNAAAYTGKQKAAIYLSESGAPTTLLGVSNEVVNPSSGNWTWTFATPVWLGAGCQYFLAILTDTTSPNIWGGNSAGLQQTGVTYASGFPNPAGTIVSGGRVPAIGGSTNPGNVTNICEPRATGDTDYVFAYNVNDTDLYDMVNLPSVGIQSIIGVVSRILWKKSDAGLRNGQMLVKSGGTTVTSPDTVMSSTYAYVAHVDPVDPATGAAWTVAGVNALQIGQKVTA